MKYRRRTSSPLANDALNEIVERSVAVLLDVVDDHVRGRVPSSAGTFHPDLRSTQYEFAAL
jgi:hypothetical protein